jgi:hypothetical protein
MTELIVYRFNTAAYTVADYVISSHNNAIIVTYKNGLEREENKSC